MKNSTLLGLLFLVFAVRTTLYGDDYDVITGLIREGREAGARGDFIKARECLVKVLYFKGG